MMVNITEESICVNIYPNSKTVTRWKGKKICSEQQFYTEVIWPWPLT